MKSGIRAVVFATCLAVVSPLGAFQRETTDDPDCVEAPGVNCPHLGTPLSWSVFPVHFFVNADGSGLSFENARDAISAAFSTWQGGSEDGIVFGFAGESQRGANGDDGCNVVSWQSLGQSAADTFAQAIITFSRNTGEIFDVDVELNSDDPFAVLPAGEDDPFDERVDLQAVSTHEVGHLLGLDHENRFGPQVVMFFSDTSGNATRRTLSSDDRRGVLAAYPEPASLGAGTTTADCASGGGGGGGGGGGCTLSPSRGATDLWPIAAVLASLAARQRRRGA
ncbi:MAG TPA: matrixin family metalloprotease [Candidatus Binatia bacterium]|nr:matrixin family metalloprotease [Candidatus Binatia bacterium]